MLRSLISYFLGMAAVAALALTGCASHQKGNYVKDAPPAAHNYLAKDAVNMLKVAYPPAKTTFVIKPTKETDFFGLALVEDLKIAGYAVYESNSLAQLDDILPSAMPDEIALKYVVDYVEIPSTDDSELGLHVTRVAIFIGNDSFTRAYARTGELLDPVGFWAYGRWLNG